MIDRRTGFSLPQSTKDRLKALKLFPSESYEAIILRLIDKHCRGD